MGQQNDTVTGTNSIETTDSGTKPWGRMKRVFENADGRRERIEVKAGGYSSRHRHNHHWNGFAVLSGRMDVRMFPDPSSKMAEIESHRVELEAGDVAVVKPGQVHQFYCYEDAVAYEDYYAVRGKRNDPEDIERFSQNGREEPEGTDEWTGLAERLKAWDGWWYLASPYSRYPDGMPAAYHEACRAAGFLIERGVKLFCPIAHSHPICHYSGVGERDHDIWLPLDKVIYSGAVGIVVAKLEGWQDSRGVMDEIGDFEAAGKPVEYMTWPRVATK